MKCYLSNYTPLVSTEYGENASEIYGIPPFVEGSIRREPDFEHPFPPITCVYRSNNFLAPKLRTDDVVVYLTERGGYGENMTGRRYLTAVLKVIEVFDTHENAAEWYRARQLHLPRNCLVAGNPPLFLALSNKDPRDPRYSAFDDPQAKWDAVYWRRTAKNGTVAVCKPLFTELGWQTKFIYERDLVDLFNRVPGFRNPSEVMTHQVNALMRRLLLPFELVAK